MAAMLAPETDWEARELIIENLRAKHSPEAIPGLQAAYAVEKDDTVRGHLHAAFLEAQNPGKCVMEDDGRAAGDICRYFCRDRNTREWSRKPGKQPCPETMEPPAAKPEVLAATPVAP